VTSASLPPPGGEAPTGRSVRGLNTVIGDLTSVTGGRVATMVLGALSVIVTTRILDPPSFAAIAYVTLGGTLMMAFASSWHSAAAARYGREELDRTGGLHRTTWARFTLSAPLAAIFGAMLIGLKAVAVLPAEFTWTLVWLSVTLGVFLVAVEQLLALLNAAGRMRLSALASVIRQAVFLAGLLVIAALGVTNSPPTVAALTVAVAVMLAVGLVAAQLREALWPPRFDSAHLRRVILFALPLVVFAASQYGIRSIDIVVLRAYRPPADVGIYALAYQSYTMLQQLCTTITIVLVPLFVSLREAGRSALVTRYFERLIPPISLAFSGAGGILAPLVIIAVPIVFGETYSDADRPLALLMGALVVLGVACLIVPILMLGERTTAIASISALALALNIAADIVLIGWLDAGVIGPAIATLATVTVIAGGYFVAARRELGTGPVLHAALPLPLAAGILPALFLAPWPGVPLGVAAAGLVTVIAFWHVPLFTNEDAELIGRLDIPDNWRRRVVRLIQRLAD
jgi:O-antigen/teichoic acid export membrane protein